MKDVTENTAKLTELAQWLRRQGDKRLVGNWELDADHMCVPADAVDEVYRGDIGGLVVTQFLRTVDAKTIHNAGSTIHPRAAVYNIWREVFGVRGEFYETFVDVDAVLEDFPALHDKLTCADYATTLEAYLARGVRGEVSWKWYVDAMYAAAPS